jgi:hypothetical protein
MPLVALMQHEVSSAGAAAVSIQRTSGVRRRLDQFVSVSLRAFASAMERSRRAALAGLRRR